MKTSRRKQGATLALVISLVFVLLLVGTVFFIWQLLVGGSRELQHATDSGNLNVAKQALKTPSYVVPNGISPFTNTNLRMEFRDVLVDSNGNPNYEVNLLNFNRLVGKAVLAQLNAQSEGTALARQNAAQLTRAVYDIGNNLRSQLTSASSLRSHFEGISNNNSVRMMQDAANPANSAVSHTDSEYAVAYMAVGKASNVYIDPNQIPAGANLPASDLVSKNVNGVKQFLAGYRSISTAAAANAPATWAVPMRPGEQPHLVSVDDFQSFSQPPAALGNVLPNAFRSGGEAQFVRTGANLGLRSHAIIGVLAQTFPMQQSGGVIIIDNTGNSFPAPYNSVSVSIPDSGSSIFAGPLMAPNGIEIFRNTAYGSFPGGGSSQEYMAYYDPSSNSTLPSDQIKSQARSTQDSGSSPSINGVDVRTFPGNMPLTGTDSWAMLMHNQPRYVSQYAERNQIMGTSGSGSQGTTVGGTACTISHITLCNNQSFSGSGNSRCTDPNNVQNVFPSFLNGQIGVSSGSTGSTTYSNLMPLEQYILLVNGGFGGGAGCVSVPPLGSSSTCSSTGQGSGMKNVTASSSAPFSEGTLAQLLQATGVSSGSSIYRDLATRMRQMAPGANPNSIFNQVVPYNRILYVTGTLNPSSNSYSLSMSTSLPSTLQYDYVSQIGNPARPLQVNNVPDGQATGGSNAIRISGNWVNHSTWECGRGMSTGTSSSYVRWVPSSGKAGLLGVLRFTNCPVAQGLDWCCP